VNILRDMPADLRAGRCYLPADELQAAGADPATILDDPSTAQPVFDAWMEKARGFLDDGRKYIRAIRPWRVRFACYVPWRLAEKTLALMARCSAASSPRSRTSRCAEQFRSRAYESAG
jgi:phytoene/squalene synthetase